MRRRVVRMQVSDNHLVEDRDEGRALLVQDLGGSRKSDPRQAVELTEQHRERLPRHYLLRAGQGGGERDTPQSTTDLLAAARALRPFR